MPIDAVEFKITVRANQEEIVRSEMRRADVEPERRLVYFFDTLDLRLAESGVVLRARISRDAPDDSTVKLRPVVPTEIDRRWRRLDGFEIELDMVGDEPVCSAKLSAEQRRDEIDEVASGKRALRKLFSEDQERLIEGFGPIGFSWDELSVLGPVNVRKWELAPNGFPREITVEEWTLPDDSDLIELSTKVEPRRAASVGAAFRRYVAERGLDPDGDQQTKTRSALRLFTAAG
jgi:hypothetical protein